MNTTYSPLIYLLTHICSLNDDSGTDIRVTGYRLDYGRMVPSIFSNVNEVLRWTPLDRPVTTHRHSAYVPTQLACTASRGHSCTTLRGHPPTCRHRHTLLATATLRGHSWCQSDFILRGTPCQQLPTFLPSPMLQLFDYDNTDYRLPAHRALTRVRGHVIWISAYQLIGTLIVHMIRRIG
jgi:hypothetical protein